MSFCIYFIAYIPFSFKFNEYYYYPHLNGDQLGKEICASD